MGIGKRALLRPQGQPTGAALPGTTTRCWLVSQPTAHFRERTSAVTSPNVSSDLKWIRGAKCSSDGKWIRPKLYRVWCAMRNRCANAGNQKWHRYGGRGIRVCADWRDYGNFRGWAIASGYGKNLSIDRVDNDGDYEPGNCRWITREQNSAKKLTRKNVREIRASALSHTALAKIYGCHNSHVQRIRARGVWRGVK